MVVSRTEEYICAIYIMPMHAGAWGCKRGEGRQASGAPNMKDCDA